MRYQVTRDAEALRYANYRHMRQNVPGDDLLPFYWSQTDMETGLCYPLVCPDARPIRRTT